MMQWSHVQVSDMVYAQINTKSHKGGPCSYYDTQANEEHSGKH